MSDDKHLEFVLRHYRKGGLDTQKALDNVKARAEQQLPKAGHRPMLRRWMAVAGALLCLAVFAAVFTRYAIRSDAPTPAPVAVDAQQQDTALLVPKTFHFDNAPLPEVLQALTDYYGVRLQADRDDKRLTGDFDADSLATTLRMIEEVLDVSITECP